MSNPFGQNIIACVWDFDKTLIPGYMQTPLFDHYGVKEAKFWDEVNSLPEIYSRRGCKVSKDTIYLNHLLSYVKNGPMRGLTNQKLHQLGGQLEFCKGLPELFEILSTIPKNQEFIDHHFKIEHYIISTGLAQMIKGSQIFPFVEDVFACEFIETPLPPNFKSQSELSLPLELEITQVGMTVDNTIKTRFIFEINKGSNKSNQIDVNAFIPHEDRRIPIEQMIYIADGPSDVPVFAVVKGMGGKTYAVYNPEDEKEFQQSCSLVERGRVHNNGPADYSNNSPTAMWIKQKVTEIFRKIINNKEKQLAEKTSVSPKHIPHSNNQTEDFSIDQKLLW